MDKVALGIKHRATMKKHGLKVRYHWACDIRGRLHTCFTHPSEQPDTPNGFVIYNRGSCFWNSYYRKDAFSFVETTFGGGTLREEKRAVEKALRQQEETTDG